MRTHTSVTLDIETLRRIDEIAGRGNRSRFIEAAVLEHVERRRRTLRDEHDRTILDANAASFERMMADVLADQVDT